MNFGLFENKIMDHFDFTKEYVGYVIDNNDFEKTFSIKVFIPELFGYNYQEFVQNRNNIVLSNIKNGTTRVSINNDNIINKENLNLSTSIDSTDYIISRVLIHRCSFKSIEEFIFDNKPDIGKKIIVKFLNGNPLNCVYQNLLFLGDNEDPYMYINKSGTITDGEKPDNIGMKETNESKVYWIVRE